MPSLRRIKRLPTIGDQLPRAALVLWIIAALSLSCGDDKKQDPPVNNHSQEDARGEDIQPDDTAQPDSTGDAEEEDSTGGDAFYIEGLSAPVKVQFDAHGVLHIDCKTNQDCFLAQGYFHADARFFEMDLIRRQTRGELTEVIGAGALSSDVQFRRLNTSADGTPLEEAYLAELSQSTREMLDAYAAGVNSWLENMRAGTQDARLSEEYEHPLLEGVEVRDWEPEDTVALYLQLAYQLGESASEDIVRGEMAARLGPEVAADLFTVKPGIESNILQASGDSAPNHLKTNLPRSHDLEAMRRIQQRLKPAQPALAQARELFDRHPSMVFGPKDGQDGSNNWALSPSRTKNGKALLASDPHLTLNSPAIWYMVELDSKTNGEGDLHVAGASIPSVPGVIIGHNEELSWGVTTARMDLADAYIEELNDDGTAVIFNGEEVPLVQKEFTFKFKDGGSGAETFEYVPHHGPILIKDVDKKVAISIRWVLQEPGNDLDFIQDLMRAKSTQEGMDSLGPVRAINQNWVFADREGNIGWNPKVAIPNRPWATADLPNWLPLPGDGSAEWEGYLSAEESPTMYNPPAGFIATANNDMDGSYTDGDATNDGHPPWQTVPAEGYRHKRIVDMIDELGDEHTPETMREIQADTYILHGETIVPHILEIADANADDLSEKATELVETLRDWEFSCPTGLDGADPKEAQKSSDPVEARESIGCSAYHVMLPYLTRAIFDDELNENPPAGVDENLNLLDNWIQFQTTLLYLFDSPDELHRGEDYFDDIRSAELVETRDDIVVAQLEYTADKLGQIFGAATDTPPDELSADDWRWGRIHTVTFQSLLTVGNFSLVEVGPYANDGGYGSVDVANPIGGEKFRDQFHHPHGASLRMIMEASDEGVVGNFQLPGGQSHHADSPYFNNLIDDWLSDKPRDLLFERADVDANAQQTIEALPAP